PARVLAGGGADPVGDRIAIGDDRPQRVGRIHLDAREERAEQLLLHRRESLADEVAGRGDQQVVLPGAVAGARAGRLWQVKLDLEPSEVGQLDVDRVADERRAARDYRPRLAAEREHSAGAGDFLVGIVDLHHARRADLERMRAVAV